MRQSDRPANHRRSLRSLIRPPFQLVTTVLLWCVLLQAVQSDETGPPDDVGQPQSGSDARPAYRTETLRGKVVWLADALKTHFGISTVPEVAENSLAILTPDGNLIPIVENLRGRAFRKDPRLREMEVEIVARRHQRHPMIQVLRLYQIDGDQRYEVDYWCDICAIVMYETGPCSCCQDDNRMRKRPVDEQNVKPDEIDPAQQ